MGIFSDKDVEKAFELLDALIERLQKREKQEMEALDEAKIKEIRKIFLERFERGLETVKEGANVPPSAIFPHILNGLLKDPKKFGMACGFLAGILHYQPKHILKYPKEFMQIMNYLIKNPDYKRFIVNRLLRWKNLMLNMKAQNKLTEEEIGKFEEFSYEIGLD